MVHGSLTADIKNYKITRKKKNKNKQYQQWASEHWTLNKLFF